MLHPFLVFFFRYRKKYLMMITPVPYDYLAMSVRLSVCPSSLEITLERGSNRSVEPIDLKISLNKGN